MPSLRSTVLGTLATQSARRCACAEHFLFVSEKILLSPTMVTTLSGARIVLSNGHPLARRPDVCRPTSGARGMAPNN
jgi:hypothetical protein